MPEKPGAECQYRELAVRVSRKSDAYCQYGLPNTVTSDYLLRSPPGPVAPTPPTIISGVYPNPAEESATLRFRVGEASPVRIELYDVVGRDLGVVYDEFVPWLWEQSIPLPVEGMATGVYHYRITVGETEGVGRFVVRH